MRPTRGSGQDGPERLNKVNSQSAETGKMTQSRILDDLGRLMNSAAGVADGVRREAETAVRSQLERVIADMDLVKREDFDALRELVQTQDREIAELRKAIETIKGGTPTG